jgi:CO/xanthine dehydrogenase FAD-binding subunit
VVLESIRGRRALPIEEFFTGRGENPFAADVDEMVTEVRLKVSNRVHGSSFHKLAYRSAIDFALVSTAAWVTVENGRISAARIAVGGAGAAPLLLKEAAGRIIGKNGDDITAINETAEQVRKHASAFMVDNLGGTLAYRVKMSEVMARRALKEALGRASGGN